MTNTNTNTYTLINLANDETLERTYDDGKRAAKIAARLSRMTGRKYQVRKLDPDAGDPNWTERETARFTSGEYIPVVPSFRTFMPERVYAHVAKKSPDLIAYTKDEQRGRLDKQSLLSIPAFIDWCLDHPEVRRRMTETARAWDYASVDEYYATQYTPRIRKALADEQRRHAIQFSSPVKFAGPLSSADADADEIKRVGDLIERVYTNYASIGALEASCMRLPAESYSARVNRKRIHPTRAYVSPDVAIAYIADADGRTLARALCWPERKIYSRVYAANDALHAALQAQGYVKSGYYGALSNARSFKGARLSRIETDCGNFAVPYLDDPCKYLDDDGDWLTMLGDEIDAGTTTGVAVGGSSGYCPHCENNCDEDDLTTVYLSSNRIRHEMWCPNCVDSDAFYCHGYECHFDNDNVDVTCVGDEFYSTRYVENNASWCDYYAEYTFEHVTDVIVNNDGDTQSWCYNALQEHAFEYGGRYYSSNIDTVGLVTERYVPQTPDRYDYAIHWYVSRALVYYVDTVEYVPHYLIDNSEIDAYLGVDGRYYLRDYVDNYPVDRPRVAEDAPVQLSWTLEHYVAEIA